MSMGRKKLMDALEGLSEDEDGATSSSNEGEGDGAGGDEGGSEASDRDGGGKQPVDGEGGSSKKRKVAGDMPAPAKKKQELTLEDLEAAGYTAGPSVLYMKPPAEAPPSWNWSDGRGQKGQEAQDTIEDRRQTHEAATTGAEEGALLAMRAVEHAERLRREAREEKDRRAAEKMLSFNAKEKRKRNTGQATRGRNFVEEEKRRQRQFGVFSGFD